MTTEIRLFVILVGVFLGIATTQVLIVGALIAFFLGLIVILIKYNYKQNTITNG